MTEFLYAHWLDMLTTALGLAYILLEYKASIWLWAVGFVMQSLGIVLYFQKGLYADCGMEFYYLAMTIYGYFHWIKKKKTLTQPIPANERSDNSKEEGDSTSLLHKDGQEGKSITHFPKRLAIIWASQRSSSGVRSTSSLPIAPTPEYPLPTPSPRHLVS